MNEDGEALSQEGESSVCNEGQDALQALGPAASSDSIHCARRTAPLIEQAAETEEQLDAAAVAGDARKSFLNAVETHESDACSSGSSAAADPGARATHSDAAGRSEAASGTEHAGHASESLSTVLAAVDGLSTADPVADGGTKAAAPTSARVENAIERLTTPTSVRMLRKLEQTQGRKTEMHIATGVVLRSKRLDAACMSAMVERLCVVKRAEDNLPSKPHAVKLAYEGTREVLIPVKRVSKQDNIDYMANLYSRCQETRAKTQAFLAEKYLQPLGKASTARPAPRTAAKAASAGAAAGNAGV